MRDSGDGLPKPDFLFVQSTTEIGGAETVLLNLFAASPELCRRSIIVSLGFGNGALPARLRATGARVVELKMPRMRYPWRLVPTFRSMLELVRTFGIRVIVGNGGHPQIVAGLLARLSGSRSAFLVHAIYSFPLWKNNRRDVLVLSSPSDLMMAVSKTSQAAISKLRPTVKTRLLYNGTPIPNVAPEDAHAARIELGAGSDDVLIGVFGRLQRSKGQDVFITAASKVARVREKAKFVVVGGSVFGFEPEYAEELKREVDALGLSDRVIFTGFRPDVPRLMAACDVVCSTSRAMESFGMVVVEGMAVGRPVIATDCGGPGEIIESDADGVLIPREDSAALTRAMIALVDDPERRRFLGERGLELVKTRFSSEIMASTLIGYLDKLIVNDL